MSIALHWFRRDFRIRDNTALYTAAANHDSVVGVFIIDPRWLGNPEMMGAHQAAFWLESLRELETSLAGRNISLVIRTNKDPVAEILAIAREIGAQTITCNKEYEPDQILMDDRLEQSAAKKNIKVLACKDAAIFEEQEILTGAGTIYSVFTPYKNAYLKRLLAEPPEIRGAPKRSAQLLKIKSEKIPAAKELGYKPVDLDIAPGEKAAAKQLAQFLKTRLKNYAADRDFPAIPGTSRLSAHLNAGTISIRQCMQAATGAFQVELIWREFYRMILFNFPQIVSKPFNENYNHIAWENDPKKFAAWCEARTGYPIVDAAITQLRQTGFMHNRLRMIAAMFLTKDLDCHWRLGEKFFMQHLVDYDQASNVGGWQWSASTGTDAAPYFRVMNPQLQSEKFDPAGGFIRKFLPALSKVPTEFIHAPHTMPPEIQKKSNCLIGVDYPAPIVGHAKAKDAAIAKFRRK
jgi:deoxyribodipyrimidine photo-lyase